ncbi:MAG: type II secretion system F family protein [Chloroflexi bacterium]|nr:MAG: type II secretion system F family protein [Chloroflexota bacterium]
MSPLVTILIGIVALVVVVLIVVLAVRYLRGAPEEADIQARLEEFAKRSDVPLSLEEIELSQPFSQRVILPILRGLSERLAKLSPTKTRESIDHQLELAGRPNNWGVTEFVGLRFFLMLLFGAMFFLIASIASGFMLALVLAGVGALIGYLMPLLWLRSKIRQRQDEIIKTLPDALDLLTITVEAGLGLDGAMQKVAEKWDNHLARGFAKVIQEIRLGVTRREALKNMDRSMEVPDVTTFVAAIIQAEQLGVSIAKVLRVQSKQMRQKRRQRAEELANKAPIKMLFPMVFLIFPALFIILLGPAFLQVMETLDIFG